MYLSGPFRVTEFIQHVYELNFMVFMFLAALDDKWNGIQS